MPPRISPGSGLVVFLLDRHGDATIAARLQTLVAIAAISTSMVDEERTSLGRHVMESPLPCPPKWASPDDWSNYRGVITRLYFEEDKPLKTVMETMEQEFGFFATYAERHEGFYSANAGI